MGKIFLNDFSTFPSTLRRADLVNHTCSRGHFAHGHLFRDVPFKCWEIQIHARFRLLLPAAHPKPLSSLLEFTILRYYFFESHHISTWEAGGGHVSGRSMTVTVLCETLRTWNLTHNIAWTYDDPSHIVCGRLFSTLFHNVPLRPGLFLSCLRNFSKGAPKFCVSIFFTRLRHRPSPLLDIQGPNISFGTTQQVVNWRLQRFNVEMFEICMFHSTVISIHMLIQTRMILIQNSNVPGVICVIIVGKCCWTKKQSEFVQQHLHVKRCWTKSPQQRINRNVSTQRRTRVCWQVLEPSIGAVGLSTLRNMLETQPLNCVILPIFLLLRPKLNELFVHSN